MWPFDIFSSEMKYKAKEAGSYYSDRYKKTISWPKGYETDGATGVPDLDIVASRVHDRICEVGKWDDGTPITNWQASNVYSDLLIRSANKIDGKFKTPRRLFRKTRAHIRKIGTFLFGGEKLEGSIAGKVKSIF